MKSLYAANIPDNQLAEEFFWSRRKILTLKLLDRSGEIECFARLSPKFLSSKHKSR
jgi:hypothetical protein